MISATALYPECFLLNLCTLIVCDGANFGSPVNISRLDSEKVQQTFLPNYQYRVDPGRDQDTVEAGHVTGLDTELTIRTWYITICFESFEDFQGRMLEAMYFEVINQ